MSTHRKIVLVLLAALSGVLARAAKGQSDEQAVKAVVNRLFDGMRARDTAMMRATIVPSTLLERTGGATGLNEPIAMSQFIDRVGHGTGPGGDERTKDPKVEIDGPLASVWVYYTFTPGGQTKIDHCGVDAFLLRKGPDGWKIFHISDTSHSDGCTPIK